MDSIVGLLPIFLIFAVFWLLILRPARQRQRAVMEVQAALAPGTEVVTAAGLYGTVVSVESDVVVLEVAPGVTNRYARQAIVRVLTPTDATGTATATPTTDAPRPEPERGPGT
jgi:preprotein translocase subunit YajC